MSLFLMIFMYATWTSVFSLSKMTLQYCPPVFLTGFRMLLAGVIIVVFLFFKKRDQLKVNGKQLFSIAVLGLFSIYLTNAFEFWGVQYISAAKACFFYSLSPFFAALFSYIHFGEKMNARKWLGFLIGFLGFIPVLMMQGGSENLLKGIFFISLPELAIMAAALCSVYGWVLLRILVKDSETSPLTANGLSMLMGGFFALIHSFFVDSWHPTPIHAGGFFGFMQGTLLIILISNIVCYNLYGFLLKKYTATFLSFVGLLSPVFASFTEWMILGTVPSIPIFVSSGIVTFGLWIVYQAELKQGYIVKAEKTETVST